MNPNLKCPECDSSELEVLPRKYRLREKTWQGVTCQGCGYHWGVELEKLKAPEPAEVVAVLAAAEPFKGKIRPLIEGVEVRAVQAEDLKQLREAIVGKAMAFERDGESLVCEVSKVTKTRVYLDVEDAPDTWVTHEQVLGLVAAGE